MYTLDQQIAEGMTFFGWPGELDCDKPRDKRNVVASSKPKPDVVLKEYFRNGAHFADLMNASFYSGEPVVLPTALSEMDSVVPAAWDNLSVEGAPDVVRCWTVRGHGGSVNRWVFILLESR